MCASSCTASPVGIASFDRASSAYEAITGAGSTLRRAQLLTEQCHTIKDSLLRYFAVAGCAEAILCPSGTDALLTATLLIAAERPGQPMTVIIPSASETGTGVPLAATCSAFDGPRAGIPLVDQAVDILEVPLRSSDGEPRPADKIDAAFAAAARAARFRPIVYVTHATKTGLVAPTSLPPGVDVIVDACQARMEPADVAAYLRRGWPVVVTGSKFFGGPAFSGAVLFPHLRLSSLRRRPQPAWPAYAGVAHAIERNPVASFGTALRWIAALAVMEAFKPLAAGMAGLLRDRAAIVHRAIGSNPALVHVSGLPPCGPGWSGLPSIFTFGVRDPGNRQRLLPAAELRPLYERLARRGILLGQPVSLGLFGGLRIAVGARDLVEGSSNTTLLRVFDAIEEATAPDASRFGHKGRSTWH